MIKDISSHPALIRPLTIGHVQLVNNLMMAPMAGITDRSFRLLAKRGGAGLVCSEMVSAAALVRRDKKTLAMAAVTDDERPVSVQLFGSNPEIMAEAAKIAEAQGADIIDINLGCPVRKIIRSGAGIKLIENQSLVSRILDEVVKSVTAPVSIKIRTGNTPSENIAPLLVRCAEERGVAMVVVHGRAAILGHTGKVNLAMIKETVSGAHIPIIGNGGIVDEFSAQEFFSKTGVSGLMIGRGAIGDFGIFSRIGSFINGGQRMPAPSWEDRLTMLRQHAALSAMNNGEKRGITMLRKVAAYYLRGLPNAARMRDRFNHTVTLTQIDSLISDIWESPYFEKAE